MAISPSMLSQLAASGKHSQTAPAQLQVNSAHALQKVAGLDLQLGKTFQIQIQKIEGQQVQFLMAGQRLTAATELPLQNGMKLEVKITQLQPQLTLQVQPANKETAQMLALQTAYRQLLPNQMPLNQGLQQLWQMSQSPALPNLVQGALSQLFEQLFRPSAQMTPHQLKQQLQGAGLFLENQLAQKGRPPQQDFKARLLQLMQWLGQPTQNAEDALEKPRQTVSQMLNRLTLQQLQASQHPQAVAIELPLHPDSPLNPIEIDIRKQTASGDPLWEVMVQTTLEAGQIKAKLVYHRATVNAGLWSDQIPLYTTIESQLDQLQLGLQQAGVPVGRLFMSPHEPQQDQTMDKVALIDIHI